MDMYECLTEILKYSQANISFSQSMFLHLGQIYIHISLSRWNGSIQIGKVDKMGVDETKLESTKWE